MLPRLPFLFTLILFLLQTISIHSQPSSWVSKGIGGGGALFSPSFNPNSANDIFVGCDMSELFRSSNLGISWQPVNFSQIQGGSNSMVQFNTVTPLLMYCINHKNDVSTPSRSIDGGATWSNLASDPTGGEAYSLYSDINNPNNILLSDYTRLFLSNNSGTTFTLKYTSVSGGGCHVAGVFFESTNIFVGTNDGLLVSNNSGSTFALVSLGGIPPANGLLSFTGARQGGVTRFFAVTADKNDIYAGIPGSDYWDISKGVYSIDYGQANWTLKMTGITQGTDFPFFSSMAGNNINTVYVAGSNNSGFPSVFKSTNAGANWVQTFITANNQNIVTGWSGTGGDRGWGYGECAMGFTVSPLDPNKIAISDFGFVHISTNGAASWQQAYVTQATQNPMNITITLGKSYEGNGIENTSCWWLTWSDANNMFASYSDIRAIRSTNSGVLWSFNYSGHAQNTMYHTVKHPNGTLYGASSTVHDMYQSTYLQDSRIDVGTGLILLSTNNGAAWSTMHNFAHPVIWLALDPTNANRMYASVIHSTLGGIFISNDIQNGAASTWTRVSLPPRTEGHPFNVKVLNDGTLICTHSGRRTAAGVFTASSGVFVSTNQGTTWTDRSHTGMQYWTKDVIVYPHDVSQNTWYVGVFSGWGGPPNGLGGLYRTTNRGVNWTKINNTDRVTSITFDPVNPDIAFMTSEINGLFYSSNVSSANPVFSSVASYSFRQPERVFYNPFNPTEIWVTSFGNGLRMGSSLIGIQNQNNEIPGEFRLYQNYPNPFNPETVIRLELPKNGNVKLSVFDMLGCELSVLKDEFMTSGNYNISFNGSEFPSGTYFCKASSGEFNSVIKIVLLK
ncbi:MAG: T9SS type A sorting domain-containing protein [Ignavibacteria bacterium]